MTAALQTLVDEGKIRAFFEDDINLDTVYVHANCTYNYAEECYDNATEELSHFMRQFMILHGYKFRYSDVESLEPDYTVECWVYTR